MYAYDDDLSPKDHEAHLLTPGFIIISKMFLAFCKYCMNFIFFVILAFSICI